MPRKVRAAGIYTRISHDRTGEMLGVQMRQRPDLEALAERKGWKIADVYTDNDISASHKHGRTAHRPDFQRLRDDITAGRIDGVLAWEMDRIFRDPFEAEEFWRACETAGMYHFATLSDDIDIASGEGIMVARIKAAVAAEEARKTAQRTRRKALELADRGAAPGGRRHFGYSQDRQTIILDEATIIREMVRRAAQGERLHVLVTDLNARRIPTTIGGTWTTQSLRKTITSPSLVGLRVHQGTVHGQGDWEPIVDRSEWETCRAVIDGSTVRRGPYGTYLLTGIARCSLCDATVHGGASTPPRAPRYTCSGHTSIPVPLVDDYVERAVLHQLDAMAIAEHSAGNPDLDDALANVAELERRHVELANDFYAERLITRDQFAAASRKLQTRIDTAKRHAATLAGVDGRRALLSEPAALVLAWPTLPLEQQRLVIDAAVTITILPGRPRVASTVDRVSIERRA
jgi:site-specific DNA recombinase